MISVIKTAIITIIISFISGLLLEYYKDLAPRILCNIGKCIPLEVNKKKICAYILTVRNLSNKTIHNLTVNVQGSQNNLKIEDAKITKGLRFDSSIKDNILDVYIPFLSKDDEFSVTLYVYVENEYEYEEYNKPVVTIRSPENFKKVDSVEQKGVLPLLCSIPKNVKKVVSKTMKNNETIVSNKKGDFSTVMNKAPGVKKTINKENREILYKSKKPSKNEKAMIAVVSVILVISIGVLGGFYFKGISTNAQTPDTKTDVQKQSTDATESASRTTKNKVKKALTTETTKNTGVKGSTSGTTKNTGAKTSTNGTAENTDTKASTGETTGNTDAKTSTDGTIGNTDAKTSTSGTTGSTDTKTSTDATTGNADTKASTDATTGGTDTQTSTGGATESTDTQTSTGGTTGSTNTKTPTGGSTGSTDTKTSTGGTTGNAGN